MYKYHDTIVSTVHELKPKMLSNARILLDRRYNLPRATYSAKYLHLKSQRYKCFAKACMHTASNRGISIKLILLIFELSFKLSIVSNPGFDAQLWFSCPLLLFFVCEKILYIFFLKESCLPFKENIADRGFEPGLQSRVQLLKAKIKK